MTHTETSPTSAPNRSWAPSNRDRLIYTWVRFEGRSQAWAACELNLNQSTVSRIIDRYERWIAHGGPSQNGGLNRDERLRAQHYLTYERNEWILASCMRLAIQMEHFSDTSKSTTKHYCSDPSRELEVHTQHSVLDRTGKVCRYLRLAHRVNMDQKKLVEQENFPALEPLTLDPNEYSQANADARDGSQLDGLFQRVDAPQPDDASDATSSFSNLQSEICNSPPPPLSPSPPPASPQPPLFGSDEISHPQFAAWSAAVSASTPQPAGPEPAAPEPAFMPATHNQQQSESPPTPVATITSVEIAPDKKTIARAYALPQKPPETTDNTATNLSPIPRTPASHPPQSPLSHPSHLMTTNDASPSTA
jgi:hypothetical protein